MEDGEMFVLSYDIPTGESAFKLKINRLLRKMRAAMAQRSVWQHPGLDELVRIAILIKNVGGRARIMEERLIFE